MRRSTVDASEMPGAEMCMAILVHSDVFVVFLTVIHERNDQTRSRT